MLTLGLLGPYVVSGVAGRIWRRRVARLWFAGMLRLTGVSVRVTGAPRTVAPTLFVANHVSYLDILLLGRFVDGLFVAKSDIAGWPAIGWLARLAGTIFVRRSLEAAREQCDMLTGIMNGGDSVILFPEGTSGLGDKVLPFKTTLFEVPYAVDPGLDVRVQPVAIAYTEVCGVPCRTRPIRSHVAWYGRMTLLPHLWRLLSLPGAEVELRFLDPVRASDFGWRRELAEACRESLQADLAR